MDTQHTETVEIAPGYVALRGGCIVSTRDWRGDNFRALREWPDSDGYMQVRVVIGGRRFTRKVHSLIAQAFCGERPSPQHEVRHLNGNRLDNNADNLAWGTKQENADDREQHGRTSRGAKHRRAIMGGLDAAKVAAYDTNVATIAELVAALREIAHATRHFASDEDCGSFGRISKISRAALAKVAG
jgi:hypothetical protein